MGRIWIGALAALLSLVWSVAAHAAAWTLPTNTKVVQQGGSGTNVYTTVQAALNSITNASATNRYLVKIMPGRYTQSVPLNMKPYVDLEGSGEENTVITSAIAHNYNIWSGLPAQPQATLIAAANTRMSNLKVENTSTANGIALLVNAASVQVQNVTAVAKGFGDGQQQHDYWAICVHGNNVSGAVVDVSLTEVSAYAEVDLANTATLQYAVAIGILDQAQATLTHGKATSRGGGWNAAVQVYHQSALIVRDSVADSGIITTAIDRGVDAMSGGSSGYLEVYNSSAWAHDTNKQTGCGASAIGGAAIVVNSVAKSTNASGYTGALSAICYLEGSIAASMIEPASCDAAMVTNCWDGTFTPIVCQ